MSTPEFKLDSNAPIVGWAEPKCGESSSASQVSFTSIPLTSFATANAYCWLSYR